MKADACSASVLSTSSSASAAVHHGLDVLHHHLLDRAELAAHVRERVAAPRVDLRHRLGERGRELLVELERDAVRPRSGPNVARNFCRTPSMKPKTTCSRSPLSTSVMHRYVRPPSTTKWNVYSSALIDLRQSTESSIFPSSTRVTVGVARLLAVLGEARRARAR